jgi:hypothetical protein
MTRPRSFRACEAFAVLGVLLRHPYSAALLAARDQLRTFPAGTPRQCAALLAANCGDVDACGWGVVFDMPATLRALIARAQAPGETPAIRRALWRCRRARDRVALQSLAVQLSAMPPALLEDGLALLNALTATPAPSSADDGQTAGNLAATDAWLAETAHAA